MAAQVRDRHRVGGVVQVGQAGEGIGLVGQCAGEVCEVGAVALHLGHRVQLRAAGHARYVDQLRASLVGPGGRPLLQLNDHIGRFPGVRMGACEHDVGALRGQRQVVLDEHLHPGQTGIDKIPGEYLLVGLLQKRGVAAPAGGGRLRPQDFCSAGLGR